MRKNQENISVLFSFHPLPVPVEESRVPANAGEFRFECSVDTKESDGRFVVGFHEGIDVPDPFDEPGSSCAHGDAELSFEKICCFLFSSPGTAIHFFVEHHPRFFDKVRDVRNRCDNVVPNKIVIGPPVVNGRKSEIITHELIVGRVVCSRLILSDRDQLIMIPVAAKGFRHFPDPLSEHILSEETVVDHLERPAVVENIHISKVIEGGE